MLEEALRAGAQRAVYTSSVAAIGPAPRGSTADEDHPFDPVAHGIPYVDSKREAETEALRVAARGLAVVIVNPAHVLGRGDLNHSSTELVRRFLTRSIPAYVDGAINIVDVRGRGRRATWPPTSAGDRASATSWAIATTRWTACSPTWVGCRAWSRRR